MQTRGHRKEILVYLSVWNCFVILILTASRRCFGASGLGARTEIPVLFVQSLDGSWPFHNDGGMDWKGREGLLGQRNHAKLGGVRKVKGSRGIREMEVLREGLH